MKQQDLPKNFRDVLEDIERCREKSARQKYLLDLSEGLLIHVCAFVLGEYKYSGISSLELEKLLLKNNTVFIHFLINFHLVSLLVYYLSQDPTMVDFIIMKLNIMMVGVLI